MWYVRDPEDGYRVLFQSASYDAAWDWIMANPPKAGRFHELIWID